VNQGKINNLADSWRSSGVDEGDTLLLHSSLKRTLITNRNLGVSLQTLLQSFLTVLGPTGTILLPLFNFDYCKGAPFDIRHTTSQMGALTEAGRKHPSAIRTWHPIYSFAVIGKHANDFKMLKNKSAYGAGSPFSLLHSLNGKIGVLDLSDQHSMTFYHYVEEQVGVPYRYLKDFEGDYTDEGGITTREIFQIYVRDLERGVETHVDPMGELLWEQGCYQGNRPQQGNGLRTIQASELFEKTAGVIREGKAEGLLYRIVPPIIKSMS
jgi:aminoglycoside 3-N-acetyltransferase